MQIDIILLGILIGGDFFGYEIMKIIRQVMVDIAKVSTGTLYYKLKRLEREGFLTSAVERDSARPPRQRYSITAAGRREFELLALENIAREGRPYWPYMSSLFFAQCLPREETAAAMRTRITYLRNTLARVGNLGRLFEGGGYPFPAALILEHGRRHLQVELEWAEEFIHALEGETRPSESAPISRGDWEEYLHSLPAREGQTF